MIVKKTQKPRFDFLEKRYIEQLKDCHSINPLTDVFQNKYTASNWFHSKGIGYTREADMIYKIATGLEAWQLRQALRITKGIRDHLSKEVLEIIAKLENTDMILVEMGLSFNQRCEQLKKMDYLPKE